MRLRPALPEPTVVTGASAPPSSSSLALLAGLVAVLPLGGQANAAAVTVGILADTSKPTTPSVASTSPVNLGVRFTSDRPGKVDALQFHRSPKQTKSYVASLWDLNGTLLGRTTFPASTTLGLADGGTADTGQPEQGTGLRRLLPRF